LRRSRPPMPIAANSLSLAPIPQAATTRPGAM